MNNLKFSLLILLFTFSVTAISAQYGVRAKYNLNTFSGFDDYIEENIRLDSDQIFSNNIGFGIDYWFRLKEHRVEFLPELHMGLKTTTTFDDLEGSTDLTYIGFNFNTQVYIFDLKGDCDCPTFSKQGPSLGKRLFVNLSPGMIYNFKNVDNDLIDVPIENQEIVLKLGIGLGFDIGITDLFTITPMINYNWAPALGFDELAFIDPLTSTNPEISSSMNQIQFQLRFGFRPDYVKRYR